MRQYFNLNIKHPHYAKRRTQSGLSGAAAYWLGECKKAVIFFDEDSVQKIQKLRKPVEAYKFIQQGVSDGAISENLITTIQDGKVWIYSPIGPATDESRIAFKRTKNDKKQVFDVPKSMLVSVLNRFPLDMAEAPLILSSMKVNQAFSRNTFREIDREKYNGNVAAIQAVTKSWEARFLVDPLDCLSSIELETLVAKLFEATGCFVPAYKGGFLAGIDLFVTPRSRIELAGLVLDPSNSGNGRATWSIQIKLSAANDVSLKDWLDDSPKHLLITLDPGPLTDQSSPMNRTFDREWIRSAVAQSPSVHEWLAESLKWLPAKNQSPPLKFKARAG